MNFHSNVFVLFSRQELHFLKNTKKRKILKNIQNRWFCHMRSHGKLIYNDILLKKIVKNLETDFY